MAKKKLSILFIVIWLTLATMLLLLPACSPAAPTGPSEILIGAVRNMTGMFASMSQGCDFGSKAAIEDVNAQGGVFVKQYNRKIPVKEITLDSQSDPTKTATLAESLILQDKVNFLTTSPTTPDEYVGAALVAERYKMPYVTAVGPADVWEYI